jgi:hypothetical protein
MSKRGRQREVEDAPYNWLLARGSSDPAAFLTGVAMLSRASEKHGLLNFRDEAGGGEKTIGEGLQEVERLRADVEASGREYVKHGRGARGAWEEAMALWIGTLEGVTGLMDVALDEAGIDAAEEYALDAAYDGIQAFGQLVGNAD